MPGFRVSTTIQCGEGPYNPVEGSGAKEAISRFEERIMDKVILILILLEPPIQCVFELIAFAGGISSDFFYFFSS
jgi:hypothetical protein